MLIVITTTRIMTRIMLALLLLLVPHDTGAMDISSVYEAGSVKVSQKKQTTTASSSSSSSKATIVSSYPHGVPGSGYGCDRKCGGPDDDEKEFDVSYTIRATLQTYTIRGTDKGMHTFPNGTLVDDVPVSMFTRTFEGVASVSSSKFCSHDDDGTTGPLGPCLQVLPGDKIKLRLINDMDHGMEALHQDKVPLEKYWKFAQKPNGPKNPLTMYGPIPDTPEVRYL